MLLLLFLLQVIIFFFRAQPIFFRFLLKSQLFKNMVKDGDKKRKMFQGAYDKLTSETALNSCDSPNDYEHWQ